MTSLAARLSSTRGTPQSPRHARWNALTARLESWGGPVLLLVMRLWMASIFFDSGLTRIGNWSSQEYLFGNIHPLPGVPPLMAAWITTGTELSLPVLLALGLFARLSALSLFIMTCVIQFIVAATPAGMENDIGNSEHYVWMMLLAAVVLRGAGPVSVDALLVRGPRSRRP